MREFIGYMLLYTALVVGITVAFGYDLTWLEKFGIIFGFIIFLGLVIAGVYFIAGQVNKMEYLYKEVNFHEYCPKCEYAKVDDIKDPCNMCLSIPMNEHSSKPVNYIPEKDKKNQIY